MAWLTQKFEGHGVSVVLESHRVQVVVPAQRVDLMLAPRSQDEAHHLAMMLRRAARRLEEIGKGLE